jgi:L-threonylcarbamoyladenylate synthase
MEYLKLGSDNEEDVLEKSVDVLKNGGTVAFPTETFYGLGVACTNEDALKRLYEIKKRPLEKALPLIIGTVEELDLIAVDIPVEATRLMERYWPGPLTIVLTAAEGLSRYLTAGTDKIAVRMPGESFALSLARKAGFPITATSANPSGIPPARDAMKVISFFGEDIDLVVDGGKSPGGMPSTIVEIIDRKVKILRPGKLRI